MTSDTPDPVTVIRITLKDDQPGREVYALCLRSLAARLAADASSAPEAKVVSGPEDTWRALPGAVDRVEDCGPGALLLTQSADRARDQFPGHLVLVGIARDGRWERWLPPAPAEPVPGSPGAAAQRN